MKIFVWVGQFTYGSLQGFLGNLGESRVVLWVALGRGMGGPIRLWQPSLEELGNHLKILVGIWVAQFALAQPPRVSWLSGGIAWLVQVGRRGGWLGPLGSWFWVE